MCFIYRIYEGIAAGNNHADEEYHFARMSDQLNTIVGVVRNGCFRLTSTSVRLNDIHEVQPLVTG